MAKGFKRILCIPDLHCPYQHQDAIDFLKAVKAKFKPDKVVVLGDEIDSHSMSYHDSDQDLFSAGHELQEAIKSLKPLYKMFPRVEVIDSNHSSMVYRKAKTHGIPRAFLKSYREFLEAPAGWTWHNDLILRMSDGNDVYFHHGKSSQIIKTSQAMSTSHIAGHYHEKFSIQYWANPKSLFFAMQTGCLVDDKSMAFSYNNVNLKRPILGCGIVIDGIPQLIPMVLKKDGRWTRKL